MPPEETGPFPLTGLSPGWSFTPTRIMSSQEYLRRLDTPFVPPTHTLAQLHAAVPKHLYARSTIKSLGYVLRDLALVLLLSCAATRVDGFVEAAFSQLTPFFAYKGTPIDATAASSFDRVVPSLVPPHHKLTTSTLLAAKESTRWAVWAAYWVFQSLVWTGMWCLGHEAGHGTLSSYHYVNDAIGFILHTALLVPYYSWRATHHAHHKATASIERDENYVPSKRSSLKLPSGAVGHVSDYHDIFDETPVYTLLRMVIMQVLGWQAYLWFNALGSPMYPPGTNHFNPSSKLFKPEHRPYVRLSNMGLLGTVSLLVLFTRAYGVEVFLKYWFGPYLLMNHWIVMITYLHHTDPSIPHYRKDEWTFVRGAAATVDRPLLGWLGRFFLHNASHNHVAHHHFPMIPFYNQPEVTRAIKPILGHSYNYDSTNAFYALYRSFTECQFIEDDDAVAFYRDKRGLAQRYLADGVGVASVDGKR